MKFLSCEKISEHKYKTPEGYLICIDSILARTGKQTYKRREVFGVDCTDAENEVDVDRTPEEVFSDKTLASFENKPLTMEHPDEDVNIENHNTLSVGFARDIKRGKTDKGEDVMLGTLVFTDADAIEAIESGEMTDLSCGYDCDIVDEANPCQRNIRGNHIALCQQGRAGIARIVDSKMKDNKSFIKGQKFKNKNGIIVEIIEPNDDNDYVRYTINGRHNTVKSESLKNMLDFNEYSLQDSVKDGYYTESDKKDKQFVKEALSEMRRYVNNWSFMSAKEKRNIGSLSELKARIKELEQVQDSAEDSLVKDNVYFVEKWTSKNGDKYDIWKDNTDEYYVALSRSGKKLARIGAKTLERAKQILQQQEDDLFDDSIKDEYHQIDMTDPWGGTRSLIVKAFSFEEAKKKAEQFKPEWKFRAGYQASKDDVDSAKRRGLYVDSIKDGYLSEEEKELVDYVIENLDHHGNADEALRLMNMYYSMYQRLARHKPNEVKEYFNKHVDDSVKDAGRSTEKMAKHEIEKLESEIFQKEKELESYMKYDYRFGSAKSSDRIQDNLKRQISKLKQKLADLKREWSYCLDSLREPTSGELKKFEDYLIQRHWHVKKLGVTWTGRIHYEVSKLLKPGDSDRLLINEIDAAEDYSGLDMTYSVGSTGKELKGVVDIDKVYVRDSNTYEEVTKNLKEQAKKEMKDAKEYVFNWRDTYHGSREKTKVEASSIKEAIKQFYDIIALGGIGTANCYIISVSPNDGYMRLYGKLSDLAKEFRDSLKQFKVKYKDSKGRQVVHLVKAKSLVDAIKQVEDDRLAPMTYKKLKELGVSKETYSKWTQEQANKYIANKSQKSKTSEKNESNISKEEYDKLLETLGDTKYEHYLEKVRIDGKYLTIDIPEDNWKDRGRLTDLFSDEGFDVHVGYDSVSILRKQLKRRINNE